MILAGEASGDEHGARVAREIRRRWPAVEMVGLGGERMAEAGVQLISALDELAVMGFAEVLRRLPFFRRLERRLVRLLREETPDLVLPIDYPGLNLRIAARAAGLGIPVLYYIGPQVWAWKAGRAARLAGLADRIAVILPFEAQLYRRHGGRAVFVGHPLLDEEARPDPKQLARKLGVEAGRPVLALFPGSRIQELRRHARPFTAAARELQRRIPGLAVIVSRVSFPAGVGVRLVSVSHYRGRRVPQGAGDRRSGQVGDQHSRGSARRDALCRCIHYSSGNVFSWRGGWYGFPMWRSPTWSRDGGSCPSSSSAT